MTKSHIGLFSTGLAALLLAGCGGGSSSSDNGQPDPTPEPPPSELRELTVDAAAGGFPPDPTIGFTYVDLESGAVLNLSDAQAADSTDWHIAFRRTEIKLNGGVSGPGEVTGAIAHTPPHFYDADGNPNVEYFQDPNINPDSMRDVLLNVERADTDGLDYEADHFIPYIINDGGAQSWFRYDFAAHTLHPNSDRWWIIRSGAGDSFAKMNVVALDQASREVGIDFYIQGPGDSAFAANPVRWNASLPDGGQSCFGFEAGQEVACEDGNWDLMFEIDGRSWSLWTNSGQKGPGAGGAFGSVTTADIADFPGAADVPAYFRDSRGGVFADAHTTYNWALYAGQKMWPNYRVYAVDLGDDKRAALQIIGYYSPETGASGHYSFRYRLLD